MVQEAQKVENKAVMMKQDEALESDPSSWHRLQIVTGRIDGAELQIVTDIAEVSVRIAGYPIGYSAHRWPCPLLVRGAGAGDKCEWQRNANCNGF